MAICSTIPPTSRFLEKIAEGYDIVSGWRKRRIDNLWLRRIPSRIANWLMAKLSGVTFMISARPLKRIAARS